MPLYNSLSADQQKAVDTYYQKGVNVLVHMMAAVNSSRFDPSTSDSDAANLDATYAGLQNRLGILEKQMTDVYNANQSIVPPQKTAIDAITNLATSVDQLNQNQAVASAVFALTGQVLASANALASG